MNKPWPAQFYTQQPSIFIYVDIVPKIQTELHKKFENCRKVHFFSRKVMLNCRNVKHRVPRFLIQTLTYINKNLKIVEKSKKIWW